MIEVLIDGILFGLQLALLAVGLVLIFGLGGVLNLAHGEFVIITGITAGMLSSLGVNILISITTGVLLAGVAGVAMDRTLLRPVYKLSGEMEILVGLFLTLGLAAAIDGVIAYLFPGLHFSINVPVEAISFFGLAFRPSSLIAGLVAVISLLLLLFFLRNTTTGKAIRAILQNQTGARLCGINVDNIRTLVFLLGGIMAGLAGVAQGLSSSVDPGAGLELTSLALIVSVVGGVRSVYGAIIAGLLLGIVNAVVSYLVGTYLALIILLVVVIGVVLFKPSGLFARSV
jgi:branched-subunit amino acid ABC-type transport system permease component